MKRLRWIWLLLVAVAVLHPVQAQQARMLNATVLQPADAPVRITTYEATYQTFEDGFSTLAFLTETVTLQNVTQEQIAAVEVQIVYLGAFGEQIDTVSETIIREINASASITETFRSPLNYMVPIYAAVAYPRQVRLEPAGRPERATIWRADSTEVANQLRRLLGRMTLAQEQE